MSKSHSIGNFVGQPVFRFRNSEHKPFGRRNHVKSIALCEVICAGDELQITTWETTTSDKGNTTSRTMQVALDKNSRDALLKFLLDNQNSDR